MFAIDFIRYMGPSLQIGVARGSPSFLGIGWYEMGITLKPLGYSRLILLISLQAPSCGGQWTYSADNTTIDYAIFADVVVIEKLRIKVTKYRWGNVLSYINIYFMPRTSDKPINFLFSSIFRDTFVCVSSSGNLQKKIIWTLSRHTKTVSSSSFSFLLIFTFLPLKTSFIK